jgi:hypothetical protein
MDTESGFAAEVVGLGVSSPVSVGTAVVGEEDESILKEMEVGRDETAAVVGELDRAIVVVVYGVPP